MTEESAGAWRSVARVQGWFSIPWMLLEGSVQQRTMV